MNILYIGVLHERKFFNKLVFSKDKKVSVSGQRWDSLVCKALAMNNKVETVTIINDPTKNRSKIFWRHHPDFQDNVIIRYIPFINISIIKTLTQFISSFFMILKWILKNRKIKDKALFTNLLYLPVNLSALALCRLFKVKIYCTVTDIPSLLLHFTASEGIKKYFAPLFIKLSKRTAKSYDGYILLTEYMNEIINKNNRPYMVLEGMVETENPEDEKKYVSKHNPPAIMYAGGLFDEFGIMDVVKSMDFIKQDCELWIFGAGDSADSIKAAAKKDSRIKFYGLVPHDLIIEKEKEASILINTRSSHDEFTKYSFPSKNLEYMSSGTPMLATKLPGIPKEYCDYFFALENNSPEEIAQRIKQILSMTEDELLSFGRKAKEFTLKNKNYIVQAAKLEQFIKDNL